MKFWGMILTFLLGLALGVSGTIFGPHLINPYLAEVFRGEVGAIEGTVATKQREGDRLLLTVLTPQGAILSVFKERGSRKSTSLSRRGIC